LAGIGHCLRIFSLYILQKIHCKFVFDNEVSSQTSFCQSWRDEVCMQLLAKGALLIRDVQLLDPTAYSDFIVVLVTLRNRI
jgi:hypothetical protein